MTDDRQQRPHEAEAGPAAQSGAELGQAWRLQVRLGARGVGLRGDAQRTLDRAVWLRAAHDPRAGTALAACRDALGAYHEVVDRSLREACAARSAAPTPGDPPGLAALAGVPAHPASADAQPAAPPGGPAGATRRHRAARALAAAAVVGVLGLVGWGGLPSWSTVTATSSGQAGEAPSERALARVAPQPAPEPPRPAAAGHRATPAAAVDGRSAPASLPQPRGGVRRLLAATLPNTPDVLDAPRSPATLAFALRSIGEAAASVTSAGAPPTPAGERPSAAPAAHGGGRGTVSWLLEDAAATVGDALDDALDTVDGGVREVDGLVDDHLPVPDLPGVGDHGSGEALEAGEADRDGDADAPSGAPDDRALLPDGRADDDRGDGPSLLDRGAPSEDGPSEPSAGVVSDEAELGR